MGHALWSAAQWVLAPRYGTMLRRTVREQLQPLGAGRWLDVGCGPHSRIAETLPGTLVGLDYAADRLPAARRNVVLCVCASATALPFASGAFDGIVCFGLLHHLSDADADAALAEMRRVTRAGGTAVLFDNVKPKSAMHRPFATLLRARDHGSYVRSEVDFRRLLTGHGFSVGPRITYAWTGLEGCWATLAPPSASAEKHATG